MATDPIAQLALEIQATEAHLKSLRERRNALIRQRYTSGTGVSELSRLALVSAPYVVRLVSKLDSYAKRQHRLTPAQRDQIASAEGNLREVAKRFGVSHQTVSNVRKKYA